MMECQVCGMLPPGEASGAGDVCVCAPSAHHEHHYVFLRQETKPTKTGWNDQVHERLIEDVFFCAGCLNYRRVPVRREVPKGYEFGWVEVPL